MSRWASLLVAAVLVVGLAAPAAANDRDDFERALGTAPQQLAPPALLGHRWTGTGTGIAGSVTVSRGELVIDDRPFDDTGADTTPQNGPPVQTAVDAATLSGLCGPSGSYATGDLTYPSGVDYAKNSSDLVQVRLAAQGSSLHVLWQLETLIATTTTGVSLLLDTDLDGSTGAAGGFTGFDTSIDVRRTAGTLAGKAVTTAVDVAANTIEVVLPLASLPVGPWRVNATSTVMPSGELADAAYVNDEPVAGAKACKLDVVQSQRLAQRRLGGALIDPKRLAVGASDVQSLQRGAFTRNYVPTLKLGEGRIGQERYAQSASADVYRGTVQPYSVYVPKSYDPSKPNPVIVLLHCLTCWHTVYDLADLPVELAESRGALIVTPFGYGEGGHYEAEAQKDAFEVLSDVSRRYAVDQERLYLTGMSMGSLGTYRLGALFPDLWARMLAVESYTTPFCVTPTPRTPGCQLAFNYLDVFANYRSVPVGVIQGALDELTPVTGGREFADTLTHMGYRFRYWEWPNRTHDPKMHGLTTDVIIPFLGSSNRERSPATVTYVQDRAMQSPGQVYDRAFWLSRMHLAEGVRFGRVDAVSGRGRAFGVTPVSGSGTDDAGSFTYRGLDGTPAASSGRNALTLTLSGIDALAVDLATARLTRTEPLTVLSTSDRAAMLRVGGTTVAIPSGEGRVVLPANATGAVAALPVVRPGLPLPATGPLLDPLLALFALAGGLGLQRRRTLKSRCARH